MCICTNNIIITYIGCWRRIHLMALKKIKNLSLLLKFKKISKSVSIIEAISQVSRLSIFKLITSKEQLTVARLQQKYTTLIKSGSIDKVIQAIDAQLLLPTFQGINDESALSIAFYAKQYEIYVLLKSRGFKQFWYEAPLEISLLSYVDQLSMKVAMNWYLYARKNINNKYMKAI